MNCSCLVLQVGVCGGHECLCSGGELLHYLLQASLLLLLWWWPCLLLLKVIRPCCCYHPILNQNDSSKLVCTCLNRDYCPFESCSCSFPAQLKGTQSYYLVLHWLVALQQMYHMEGFRFGWHLHWLHRVTSSILQVVHVLRKLRLSHVLRPPSLASLDLIIIGSYLRPSPQEARMPHHVPCP